MCKEDNSNNKNAITFKIKPEQGVSIRFIGQSTGPKLCIGTFSTDFYYKDSFINEVDNYESIIFEALYGDHTIFGNKQGVEYAWKKCFIEEKDGMLKFYESDSKGPEEVKNFIRDCR